jgi:hypothetical protein
MVFGAITTITTNLIATDKDSRLRDNGLDARIDKIENCVTSTTVELAYIKDSIREQKEMSREQLKILQAIQAK